MENINFGGTYEIKDGRKHKDLVGRLMKVTKASKKPGFVNGFLCHPKTGVPQKSEISIPFENLSPVLLPAIPFTLPEMEVKVEAPKTKKVKTKKVG